MPKARSRNATKAEVARHFRVSLTTLDNWLRRGCPHSTERGHRVFDLEAIELWRHLQDARNSDPFVRDLCAKPLPALIEDAHDSQGRLALAFRIGHSMHPHRAAIKRHLLSICEALDALGEFV